MTAEEKSDYILAVQNTFLKNRLVGLIPVDVYDYLEENGAIDLNNDEKFKIREFVESVFKGLCSSPDYAIRRKHQLIRENIKHMETYIRNECKRQAVANFFILEFEIDNF